MLARLGNVIYWFACGVAGLSVLMAGAVALSPGESAGWIFGYLVFGGLVWLVGRAVRYILAGT